MCAAPLPACTCTLHMPALGHHAQHAARLSIACWTLQRFLDQNYAKTSYYPVSCFKDLRDNMMATLNDSSVRVILRTW